eukprot:COSAG06_NODE_21615_length_751_cov_0.671779_2_plen_45_part_01
MINVDLMVRILEQCSQQCISISLIINALMMRCRTEMHPKVIEGNY